MYNKRTYYEVDYGRIKNNLKKIMKEKDISIYNLSRMTNTKYEIVKSYYNDDLYQYSKEILAKFCYVLDCELSEIIIYEKSKTVVK